MTRRGKSEAARCFGDDARTPRNPLARAGRKGFARKRITPRMLAGYDDGR
jgi:hypothetical protein